MARTTSDLVQMFTDRPADFVDDESTEYAQSAVWYLSLKQGHWITDVARREGIQNRTCDGFIAHGFTPDGVPFRVMDRNRTVTIRLFVSCPLSLREEWIADPAAC